MISTAYTAVECRLDVLLDNLPAGVVVHEADGRIRSANRLACELLGRDVDQLRAMAADGSEWHFLREDGTPMSVDEFPLNVVLRSRAKLSGQVVGVCFPEPEPVRWLICNAYPEFDGQGLLAQVVVCFTDCTSLKVAEQRLQRSEERLSLALRGSTDAPWDYDLVKNEVFYSERWCDMLGYPSMIGSTDPVFWRSVLHPDDAQRITTFMETLLGGANNTYSVEFRLRHRDGHYVPVLARGFVTRDATGNAVRLSGTNTDLTERKQSEQRIYELAYFDHLTGLPNRRLLFEELDKALARSHRSRRYGAVVLLDLDNFKLLNDTMGHAYGDLLLRQLAGRLRRALRHGDQLARLGGDEFVIVFEDLGTCAQEAVTEVNHVLDKVQRVLRKPYQLDGRPFSSTSSIGVVMFNGGVSNIETLLKQCDLAMYQAKAEGRNTACFFDPGMQATAEHQAALERALRDGLAENQFVLYCQPQFSCRGPLSGAEVLVRWRRADGRLVGPDEFIGLAESSGLIMPLGQYVLEQSCRALARWRGNAALSKVDLAVNVSARQLRTAHFSNALASILEQTGAPPERLCLELTESVFAGNVADMIGRMQCLCGQGVHLSLDDFGTGYSSLAYLRHFPLSALKIDRSFVHDVHTNPEAVPIVEAIIALARKLKLDIVAEGVEYEAQRAFLIEGGCETLQGYLLGRPMPIEDFERLYGGASVERT